MVGAVDDQLRRTDVLPPGQEVPALNLDLHWRLTATEDIPLGTELQVHHACRHGDVLVGRDLDGDRFLDPEGDRASSIDELKQGDSGVIWSGTTGVPANMPAASICEVSFAARVGGDRWSKPMGAVCLRRHASTNAPRATIGACPRDELHPAHPVRVPQVRWTDDGYAGWVPVTQTSPVRAGYMPWLRVTKGPPGAADEMFAMYASGTAGSLRGLRPGESTLLLFGGELEPAERMQIDVGAGPEVENAKKLPPIHRSFCLTRSKMADGDGWDPVWPIWAMGRPSIDGRLVPGRPTQPACHLFLMRADAA